MSRTLLIIFISVELTSILVIDNIFSFFYPVIASTIPLNDQSDCVETVLDFPPSIYPSNYNNTINDAVDLTQVNKMQDILDQIKQKINLLQREHLHQYFFLAKLLLSLKTHKKLALIMHKYCKKQIDYHIQRYFSQMLQLDDFHLQLKTNKLLLQQSLLR